MRYQEVRAERLLVVWSMLVCVGGLACAGLCYWSDPSWFKFMTCPTGVSGTRQVRQERKQILTAAIEQAAKVTG